MQFHSGSEHSGLRLETDMETAWRQTWRQTWRRRGDGMETDLETVVNSVLALIRVVFVDLVFDAGLHVPL